MTRTPSGTPEALQRVGAKAPTRGCCVLVETHPEGGAKIPAPCCNPSWVDDRFRRFPGCASRPATRFNASGVADGPLVVSGDQFRAPKGQPVTARGGTPGTTPHNVLRALKGHTAQGTCVHRSLRWGEVSWHGMTQGSAPLHLGLSPCAALRRERAREACPEGPGRGRRRSQGARESSWQSDRF